MTVTTIPKLTQEKARYSCRPRVVYKCGTCAHFDECKDCPKGIGTCDEVEGKVSRPCGCLLWSPIDRRDVRFRILDKAPVLR